MRPPLYALPLLLALLSAPAAIAQSLWVGWGFNYYGQATFPQAPPDVVKAVAAGGKHTVVLGADGTVVAWGNNSHGQTDVPAGLSGVVDVAAGGRHTFALVAAPTNVPPAAEAGAFSLARVWPNPTAGAATVAFSVPDAAPARLSVYDALGREVARLVDGAVGAGPHTAVFEGGALPSGTYLVRLESGGAVATTLLTLVR